MQRAITGQCRRIAKDRLLEIAHHAEVARPRRRLRLLRPETARGRRPRDLEEDAELLRGGVLRFVEDDPIMFLAYPPNDIRLAHERAGQRHLIRVSDQAALETEIAIRALHLRGDTKRAGVHPLAQGPEGVAPQPDEFFRIAGTQRPRRKSVALAPAFLPAPQVRLVFRNRANRRTLCDHGVNLGKVCVRAGCVGLDRAQVDFAAAGQLHQLTRLHMPEQDTPVFLA